MALGCRRETNNQDSALTSWPSSGSFRFPRPSMNAAHPLRWLFAVQAATRPAAADQVHDRRPLRGSFLGAFTTFSHRRISRSFQPSRSVTSWRNCEFSSSSSAILSPSLSVRSAISLCSFPRVAKSFAGANFVATSILECLFLLVIAAPSPVHLFLR
jgi:hypothetical protein